MRGALKRVHPRHAGRTYRRGLVAMRDKTRVRGTRYHVVMQRSVSGTGSGGVRRRSVSATEVRVVPERYASETTKSAMPRGICSSVVTLLALLVGLAACDHSDEDIRTTGPTGASNPDASVSAGDSGDRSEAGSGTQSTMDAGAAASSSTDDDESQQMNGVDGDPDVSAPGDGAAGDGAETSDDGTAEGADAGPAAASPDGEASCEVTPVSGLWLGRLADPTMLFLERTEEGISGWACIGPVDPATVPEESNDCGRLSVLEDRGRSLHFVFGVASGGSYWVEASLTLSPERNALFGDYSWAQPLADADPPRRGMLVPHPDQPTLLEATSCSGGEPGGECFDAPLLVDGAKQAWVTALENDDLLLTWRNDRGGVSRLAFARFVAATGSWQAPRFVQDEPIDAVLGLDANGAGSATVAWVADGALWTQHYEAEVDEWSAPRLVQSPIDEARYAAWPLVAPDGDTTLVWLDGGRGYVSHWQGTSWEQQLELGEVGDLDIGAGADGSAVMVFKGATTGPLRWSRRRAGETFSAPAPLPPSGESQRVALTVAASGDALVLWARGAQGVYSSYYSSASDAWSEPQSVLETDAPFLELSLSTDADGTARAGIYLSQTATSTSQTLITSYDAESGTWSEPFEGEDGDVPEDDRPYHAVEYYQQGISVSPTDPAVPAIPRLIFGDCSGY